MSLLRVLCVLFLGLLPMAAMAFDAGHAPFRLQAGKAFSPYENFFVNVLPGESLPLRIVGSPPGAEFTITSDTGRMHASGPRMWEWRAPKQPGYARITVTRDDGATVRLIAFVLRPLEHVEKERLEGYRIGAYPKKPLGGNPVYLPPTGLIRVSRDMAALPVSPHFTLGQFLCKQQPDHWPKYLALRPQLLLKLEMILAELNRLGVAADTLSILSGYRTPWYNATIGNGAYSRHIWGGAADIFVDRSGDGRMDDLNGDGRIDTGDARWLLNVIDNLFERDDTPSMPGGRGLYGPRPHRGPFVHVDARGWPAFWESP